MKKKGPPMSDEKFTPGEWEVLFDDGNDMHVVTMGTALNGGNPCQVHHRIEYDHGLYPDAGTQQHLQFLEADANAHLISAAPNLYRACKAAMACMTTTGAQAPEAETIEALRLALQKAGGG